MQVFDISKRFEQFTNTAREVQFDLNFGLLLLGKCNSLRIGVSYCSESTFHCRKQLSCCSESKIRFGWRFPTAQRVKKHLFKRF